MDSYKQSLISAHQLNESDPLERRIISVIRDEMMREPWAQVAGRKVAESQKQALRGMIERREDAGAVRTLAQEALRSFAELFRSEIEEGGSVLGSIEGDRPVLLATNHFGAYKLFPIELERDLGVRIPGLEKICPWFAFIGSLYPIASKMGYELSYASLENIGVLDEIHRKAGFLRVPPPVIKNRTAILDEQVQQLAKTRPHTAIVNFPEGGTTGKRNGGGAYDLEKFKTGGYVIAANHGMPVIPVAQYFDPKLGFRLKVFEPHVPEVGEKAYFDEVASNDQKKIQAWLDERQEH